MDELVVLEYFFDDQEDGVFVVDQVLELVDLGEVAEELTVKGHALVGEFIVRPVLLNDPVHHSQHHILLVIRLAQQVMLLMLLAVGRLFHQHYHVLEQGVFVLAVYVKDGLLL